MIDIFCVFVVLWWEVVQDIVTTLFPRQILDDSLMWEFYPEIAVKHLVKRYGSVNSAIAELFKQNKGHFLARGFALYFLLISIPNIYTLKTKKNSQYISIKNSHCISGHRIIASKRYSSCIGYYPIKNTDSVTQEYKLNLVNHQECLSVNSQDDKWYPHARPHLK